MEGIEIPFENFHNDLSFLQFGVRCIENFTFHRMGSENKGARKNQGTEKSRYIYPLEGLVYDKAVRLIFADNPMIHLKYTVKTRSYS